MYGDTKFAAQPFVLLPKGSETILRNVKRVLSIQCTKVKENFSITPTWMWALGSCDRAS